MVYEGLGLKDSKRKDIYKDSYETVHGARRTTTEMIRYGWME
jgi:hypothetical protein